MKFKIIALLFIFLSIESFAQDVDIFADNRPSEYQEYDWEKEPSLSVLSEEEKKFNAIYITDYHVQQFENEMIGNNNFLFQYETHHVRMVLNNDAGVESFNKVYISMSGIKKVIAIKARAISPKGKVTNFDESNKKEIDNYENYGPFTIFALEGVEVGSEIEYIYVTKKTNLSTSAFTSREYIQSDYPKKNVTYELLAPSYLVFKSKSYYGVPEFKIDSINDDEITRYSIKIDNLPAFEKEEYALDEALLGKVEYKLDENTSSGTKNLGSYKKTMQDYAESMYEVSDKKIRKKEAKAAKKLFKELQLEGKSQRELIGTLENYLKTKIQMEGGGEARFIHEILKTKKCSKYLATRMMLRLLDIYKIDHQLVLACNRFSTGFDEEFETTNFMEKFLIYFPKYDQYIDPTSDAFRLGLVAAAYTYQKGIFMKRVSFGGATSALVEIKDIRGPNTDVNYDNMELDIKIDDEFEKLNIDLKLTASGYSAANIRPFFPYLDAERRKKLLDSKLKVVGEDAVVTKDMLVENEEMTGYMLETPLIMKGSVSIESLLEKAGPKYLIKIGQVIGPQVEMYQEKERKFGVENVYNHGYNRVLKIEIPEGYTVTNLEDLKMDVFSPPIGKRTMEFTCNYELKGNQLIITVNEFYDEIRVPVNRYEEFRSVINAAADFNKKILVLEKK